MKRSKKLHRTAQGGYHRRDSAWSYKARDEVIGREAAVADALSDLPADDRNLFFVFERIVVPIDRQDTTATLLERWTAKWLERVHREVNDRYIKTVPQ